MPSALETPSAGPYESGILPLAGKPAPKEILVDVSRLEKDYFERRPDLHDPSQMVSFGTSGHRGTPVNGTFTEAHILAITQAICEYRREQRTDGPLYSVWSGFRRDNGSVTISRFSTNGSNLFSAK